MLNKKKILDAIHKNKEGIMAYGIKKIGIFGSFLHSSQNRRSDIDILIEFQPGQKKFDNYMELKFMLEKIFHRKVDISIKDALKPRIKRDILREVLYA